MLSPRFRQVWLFCVVVGLMMAVFVMVTAVTAEPPVLPGTLEERTLLPHWPQAEGTKIPESSVLSPNIPSWSKGVFQSYRNGNWEIYSSQAPSRLTTNNSSDIQPRYNRGTTRVVFSSDRDGDYEIYVMNADGSGVQALTSNTASDVNPIWSPDGSKIVFQSYRDGQAEIYMMNANGSNQTRLTAHVNYDGDPTWSPDGSKIAFRSTRTGTPFIYVMNSNGTGVTQLSTQPSYYSAWSPDGSQIAYTADLDGDNFFEIWLMNADGSNQRLLFDPYEEQSDAWVRGWSPDGTEITFTYIHFKKYQGVWYWEWAYLSTYDVLNSWPGTLDLTGLDWHPDWQTTDAVPPQTAIENMTAFSQIPDFQVRWSGNDQQTGAGLAAYDVQYRVGPFGSWVDWQSGVIETSAMYTAVPGTTVTFRARAHDNAYNWETWSTFGNPATTFYTWPLWGQLTDNRGAPLTNASLSISPAPLNETTTNSNGEFFTRLKTEGSHILDVNRSGYGDLAQTNLNLESIPHIYLPPSNNVLLNGSFEAAQPLANWTSVGAVTAVTNPRHTGTKSVFLGNTNCPYPCLTAGEVITFNTKVPDMATDSQGTLHIVRNSDTGQIIYTNRLTTGVWSEIQILNSVSGSRPKLAIDLNDVLHVLWTDNHNIYYSYSSSSDSWHTPIVVATIAQGANVVSFVSDSQGGLHALIESGTPEYPSGSSYLYRQPDGIWQSLVSLVTPEYLTNYSNGLMAIGPDDSLHFMWFLLHYTGSPWIAELIYQQRFSDGTWGNKIRPSIIENDSNIRLESMAVAPNGTLHVTWQGFASSDSSSTFHAMHAVNGLWSEPILVHQREANTTENLPTSHISVDSQGNVHAVFTMIPQEDLNAYYRLWRPGSGWQPEVSLENETWYNAAPITTIDPYGIVHLMVPKENEGSIYFRSLPATTSSIASLSQQVTIPVNMPAPTLSFMAQRPGDVPDDASSFELLVSGGVTTTAVPLVSGASDWSHYWVDMSPWAGQTVTINFQLTQTSGDPRVQAAIDDVTLGSAYPDAWVSGNGPGVALPGETVIYHIEYGNHGRIATANGEVMAAWPEYLTFVSANITPTLGADTLTWSFEELGTEYGPVKLVLTATVDASAPFGENINLPISIRSATSEVELINNQIVIPLLIVHQTFLPVLFKP